MGVLVGIGSDLDDIDDTVKVVIPDGLDRLSTVTLGDANALHKYLVALTAPQSMEVTTLAADCRGGLVPCVFTGNYVGLTEPLGEFANTGVAFEFETGNYRERVALPFGWLVSIRVA